MIWKSVLEGLPTPNTTVYPNGAVGVECSKECIVTDGEDKWIEEFIFDEDGYGFHESVTHYCAIEDIDLPTID